MASEFIEDIIKIIVDSKQATKDYRDFLDQIARARQDDERKSDGHVKRRIEHYRKEAQAAIDSYKKQADYKERMRQYERDMDARALQDVIKNAEAERRERARIYNAMQADRKAHLDSIAKAEAAAAKAAGKPDNKENNLQLARMGRVGAGLATMTGNYGVAGGLYAASNAAQMAGLTVSAGAAIGVGAAGGGALAAGGLLMYGRELNIELAKMSTLLLPASAGTEELSTAMSSAAESAARLAARFNVDVVDVVKAYKEALSSGIEAEDLERFGKVAGTLSKALGEDFGKSVTVLTTFKDTYGATISDLGEFNDVLFNVVDKGRVNASQMLNNFGRMLPIAKAAGIELKDLSAVFATLSRQMTVAQATTSTMRIIEGIVNPSDKAKKAFQSLGVQFGQTAFEGRTLVEVLNDITKRTGGSAELITALFPEVQASRGVTSVSKTLELLNKMPSAMDEVKTASVAAARAQDTLWENMGRDIESVTSKIKIYGSELANVINKVVYFSRQKSPDLSQRKNELFSYLYDLGVTGSEKFLSSGQVEGLTSYQKELMTSETVRGQKRWNFIPGLKDEFSEYRADREINLKDKAKSDKITEETSLNLDIERLSKHAAKLRSTELKERMSPAQEDMLQARDAKREAWLESGDVAITNKRIRAKHGVSDPALLRKANEEEAAERKVLANVIAAYDAQTKSIEDTILAQREYKDVMKDEIAARKEAIQQIKNKNNADKLIEKQVSDSKTKTAARDKAKGLKPGTFGYAPDQSIYIMTKSEAITAEEKKINADLDKEEKAKAEEDRLTKHILEVKEKRARAKLKKEEKGPRGGDNKIRTFYEDGRLVMTNIPMEERNKEIEEHKKALDEVKMSYHNGTLVMKIGTSVVKESAKAEAEAWANLGSVAIASANDVNMASNMLTATAMAILATAKHVSGYGSGGIVNNNGGNTVTVNGAGKDIKEVAAEVTKAIEESGKKKTTQSNLQKHTPIPTYNNYVSSSADGSLR